MLGSVRNREQKGGFLLVFFFSCCLSVHHPGEPSSLPGKGDLEQGRDGGVGSALGEPLPWDSFRCHSRQNGRLAFSRHRLVRCAKICVSFSCEFCHYGQILPLNQGIPKKKKKNPTEIYCLSKKASCDSSLEMGLGPTRGAALSPCPAGTLPTVLRLVEGVMCPLSATGVLK